MGGIGPARSSGTSSASTPVRSVAISLNFPGFPVAMTSVILWRGGWFVKALIGVGAKNTDGLRGTDSQNTPMDSTELDPRATGKRRGPDGPGSKLTFPPSDGDGRPTASMPTMSRKEQIGR